MAKELQTWEEFRSILNRAIDRARRRDSLRPRDHPARPPEAEAISLAGLVRRAERRARIRRDDPA